MWKIKFTHTHTDTCVFVFLHALKWITSLRWERAFTVQSVASFTRLRLDRNSYLQSGVINLSDSPAYLNGSQRTRKVHQFSLVLKLDSKVWDNSYIEVTEDQIMFRFSVCALKTVLLLKVMYVAVAGSLLHLRWSGTNHKRVLQFPSFAMSHYAYISFPPTTDLLDKRARTH